MADIVYRSTKGSPLTSTEVDSNFHIVENRASNILSKAISDGTTVLTLNEVDSGYIKLSGTLTANATIEIPQGRNKSWEIKNGTTGGYSVYVKVTGGTISVPILPSTWETIDVENNEVIDKKIYHEGANGKIGIGTTIYNWTGCSIDFGGNGNGGIGSFQSPLNEQYLYVTNNCYFDSITSAMKSKTTGFSSILSIQKEYFSLMLSLQSYNAGDTAVYDTALRVSRTGLETYSGTEAEPSISFTSDPDTGIYRYSANTIALTAGGLRQMMVSTLGQFNYGHMYLYTSNNIAASAGDVAIPSNIQYFVGKYWTGSASADYVSYLRHVISDNSPITSRLQVVFSATEKAYISNAGAMWIAGALTQNSDEKLKDDIQIIPNALEKVEQLRGVTFVRNDQEDKTRQTGVIAQDVQKVLPEAVVMQEDGTLSVAYGNIVGLLIESIKELKQEFEQYKLEHP